MTQVYPPREWLIICAAGMALQSLRDELLKYHNNDDDKAVAEVIKAVWQGKSAMTSDIAIKDRLAYVRQTLRVSPEEWDSVVKVQYKPRGE